MNRSAMRIIPLVVLCGLTLSANASSILASTFGYNSTDATVAFQNAVNSANDTIIIDLQTADWNVGPNLFFDLEEKTLIFQPGTVLRAIPGAFTGTGACLLKLVRCHNITIIGYSASFIMNKPEYVLLNDSEYRHALHIDNGVDITVKGLTLRDSGGDGIFVSGANNLGEPRTYSENILLEDLRCINNYRQGLSICSVEGLLVRHCLFTQTNGTLPEAGVDIEPYAPYQRVVDVVFEKCSFTENHHRGIMVALFELDGTSLPVNITFNDCFTSNNGLSSIGPNRSEIEVTCDDGALPGTLTFNRCHADNSQWPAVFVRKPADALNTLFNDCVFSNVSQQQVQYNNPLAAEVSNYFEPCAGFGGVAFNNCLLTYNTSFAYFLGYGATTTPGVTDISYTGTVVAPNGQGLELVNSADTINCSFAPNLLNAVPPTIMEHAFLNTTAEECGPQSAVFQATRTSTDLSFPLPFRYLTDGTVTFGDDVHLLTGSLMIPSGATTNTDPITPRADDITESPEIVDVQAGYSDLYTLPQSVPYSANVFDCLGTAVEVRNNERVLVWPNPFSTHFEINGLNQNASVMVKDALGRVVHTAPVNGSMGAAWPAGLYLLTFSASGSRITQRIVKQ